MTPDILVMFDVWDNAINNFPQNFFGVKVIKLFSLSAKAKKLECLSLVFFLF